MVVVNTTKSVAAELQVRHAAIFPKMHLDMPKLVNRPSEHFSSPTLQASSGLVINICVSQRNSRSGTAVPVLVPSR
eukprot:SAG31_NODE_6376_length_2039_cov_8.974742_1_plen_76_part_00